MNVFRDLKMPTAEEKKQFMADLWKNKMNPDWVIPIYNDCQVMGVIHRTIANPNYCNSEVACTSCAMLKIFIPAQYINDEKQPKENT